MLALAFIYDPFLCVRAARVCERQHICACFSEHSLLADFISTQNLYACPYGPRHEKPCLQGIFLKNTDQPAHPRRLICAFVIHCLISIISKLATGEISICQLVSVVKETGLSIPLSETLDTWRPI